MYENSEADGNIDKAAILVSPDGAQRVVSPPSSAHVSFGQQQIAESAPFIWAAETYSGHVKEAMKDFRPNAHLQHYWLLLASVEEQSGKTRPAVTATQNNIVS